MRSPGPVAASVEVAAPSLGHVRPAPVVVRHHEAIPAEGPQRVFDSPTGAVVVCGSKLGVAVRKVCEASLHRG